MIIAIGSFDGYHRGHQALFHEAATMADKLCCPWVPLTFHPHPAALTGNSEIPFLFTEEEKKVIRTFLSIPTPWILPFDQRLCSLDATDFLAELHWKQRLSGIAVGQGFRFGKGRQGTTELLQQWCTHQNMAFCAVPSLLDSSGQVISSSRIRHFVAEGDVPKAADLLGHPWFFTGSVVSGERRGRKLGFPTANLSVPSDKIMAGEGVYGAITMRDGAWIPVALSIGRNPTFTSRGPLTIEAHLVENDEDLYGQELMIWLLRKLRPMKHFDAVEDLIAQISEDTRKSCSIAKTFSNSATARQLRHILSHDKMNSVCRGHDASEQ